MRSSEFLHTPLSFIQHFVRVSSSDSCPCREKQKCPRSIGQITSLHLAVWLHSALITLIVLLAIQLLVVLSLLVLGEFACRIRILFCWLFLWPDAPHVEESGESSCSWQLPAGPPFTTQLMWMPDVCLGGLPWNHQTASYNCQTPFLKALKQIMELVLSDVSLSTEGDLEAPLGRTKTQMSSNLRG